MTTCYLCGRKISKLGGKVASHRAKGSKREECEAAGMPWASMQNQIDLLKLLAERPKR